MFTEYAPSQIETIFYRNAIVYNGGAAEKRMLFLVHFVYLICATISTFKGANKSPRPWGGWGKNATNNLYKQKLTPKLFCLLHDVVHLPTYLPTYCRRYLNSNKLNIRELNVL